MVEDFQPAARRLAHSLQWLSRSVLRLALIGSLLLWVAQPPSMVGWLAYLAPAPWLLLILREDLSGLRTWVKLWLAGSAYWAAAVYWVSLPHPLTPIGLVFLAGYLGFYLPLFVAIARVGVHRAGMPLWLAAPIAWTALEWIQAHLFSGFLMGALSHTQAWYPDVIQIAEWCGAYGVSFVVMMFAAGIVDGCMKLWLRRHPETVQLNRRPPIGFFAAAIPLAIVLFVGHHALRKADERYTAKPRPVVALIQGDTRATWDADPDRPRRIMERHRLLSKQAVDRAAKEGQEIDLMIWPESMFMTPIVTFDGDLAIPAKYASPTSGNVQAAQAEFRAMASWTNTPALYGISRFDVLPPYPESLAEVQMEAYNAAVMVDAAGEPQAVYSKMHRVPYGEYIPFFEDWQVMYFLTPMPGGIRPGSAPVAMRIGARDEPLGVGESNESTVIISPNICYETVIPHVIRRQVAQLQDEGSPPDLLVNVTNNAWFWGSSELEMHLACNIFRAVENRTPMVVAANGGLSTVIDSGGRVLEVSDRMTEQVIIAEAPLDPRVSFYTRHGDLLAWTCLIVSAGLAIIGVSRRFRQVK